MASDPEKIDATKKPATKTVKLKFVSETKKEYRGVDPETSKEVYATSFDVTRTDKDGKKVIVVPKSDVISVSETKAEQLLEDFPDDWKLL